MLTCLLALKLEKLRCYACWQILVSLVWPRIVLSKKRWKLLQLKTEDITQYLTYCIQQCTNTCNPVSSFFIGSKLGFWNQKPWVKCFLDLHVACSHPYNSQNLGKAVFKVISFMSLIHTRTFTLLYRWQFHPGVFTWQLCPAAGMLYVRFYQDYA